MPKFISKNKITSAAIVILALLGVFSLALHKTETQNIIPAPESQKISAAVGRIAKPKHEKAPAGNNNTQKNTESVTMLAGGGTAHLSVAPNTNFYDALVQAEN